MLQALEILAREKSSHKRRELLHQLTDEFFLMPGSRSQSEFDLYDEIVQIVLDDVEIVARVELASRLADLEPGPRKVVLRLAEDEFQVAEPILVRSRLLSEANLEKIAKRHSQDHLNAIAQRKDLSERVTDVLVDRGDERVVDTVAGNFGARFSDRGFTTLANRAEASEKLRARLFARSDLPEQIAAKLAPVIAEKLQAKFNAAGASIDPEALETLKGQSSEILADRLRNNGKQSHRELSEMIKLIEHGLLGLDEAVIELADVDAAISVAKLLAEKVGLRQDTVMRAMWSSQQEPGLIIARAAHLNLDAFSAIQRLRRRRFPSVKMQEPSEILRSYLDISQPMIDRVMRFLKVRETSPRVA